MSFRGRTYTFAKHVAGILVSSAVSALIIKMSSPLLGTNYFAGIVTGTLTGYIMGYLCTKFSYHETRQIFSELGITHLGGVESYVFSWTRIWRIVLAVACASLFMLVFWLILDFIWTSIWNYWMFDIAMDAQIAGQGGTTIGDAWWHLKHDYLSIWTWSTGTLAGSISGYIWGSVFQRRDRNKLLEIMKDVGVSWIDTGGN